ncbi:hypothetical protein P256_02078 [Acinetobacter nectaris CIP 110549]|uniref:Type IV secretion protein Rhs n=1 Tax=Acinetobacter nectaris CIP 110549 TaxID=1392540 RepID=V2TNV6_9GAMM|nr:hypothetical protein [Acinetobacter nectaris]ESK37645.1 hypothetical protein P256_02078 [Acinetobacter nectaris CIP 110549]
MLISIWQKLNQIFIVQKRSLTSGEKQLIQSVFNNHIVLENVEIIAHKAVMKNYAMSPNGKVYFNPVNWVEDFSILDIYKQSWFIHEMVHVWQLQQGVNVVLGAICNRRYRYKLKYGKAFHCYGVEQQAQMVQDYFLKKKLALPCDDLKQCIPFLCLMP